LHIYNLIYSRYMNCYFANMQAKMVGVDLSAREYYIPGPSGSYLNYGAAASEVSLSYT
jgi:hypothetical protein